MSERGQIRRRLREQRRLRETLLLDLGALVYELHRQGRRAPELLQSKAAELTVVDDEVRELQAALEGREGAAEAEPVDAADAGEERPEDEEQPPDEDPPHEEEQPHDDEPAPDEPSDEREPLEDDTAEFEAQADPDQEPALADHEDSRG